MRPKALLPATWDVPQRFRDRLGSSVGRQRAMVHDGHLLLVLHAPPKEDQDEREGRFFWRNPEGEWASNKKGGGIGSVIKHLDEYHEQLDLLDKQEEQARSAEHYFAVLESLTPLNRAVRNLYATLQDARTQCPDAREIIDLRDQAYQLQRQAELLAGGTKNALDFQMARRAEQQSRASAQMANSAHRLNILAAFFFPLATLSAIFGMEIPGGFEKLLSPLLFLIGVVLLGLLLGVVLTQFVRIRKDHSG